MVTIQYSLIATALNITYYSSKLHIAPLLLPRSHAQGDGSEIVDLFNNLGDLWEPEGIIRLGLDRFVVSAGEYTEPTIPFNTTINGTDRSPGAGFAHLVVFSGSRTSLADAILTKQGAIEYHIGGLDYDGRYIWATIAQYRPNSTASLVRVDPNTLDPTPIFHYTDHLGGICVATIGTALNLGGITIVDVESMVPLVEMLVTMTSDAGTLVTQNPVDVSVSEDGQLIKPQSCPIFIVVEKLAQFPSL
ncbi:hypothetical protein F5890DRAFT_1557047 [Lentinula detonsa]|uniref:Uncharacterized protein n=1 Tax=Lentinula detonsa TaxID=2804962 RepID=A0AA38PT59_9AGAR|nr:hypothetical protein F5890DRAFT_1557047 [Lentinula detonsa]